MFCLNIDFICFFLFRKFDLIIRLFPIIFLDSNILNVAIADYLFAFLSTKLVILLVVPNFVAWSKYFL